MDEPIRPWDRQCAAISAWLLKQRLEMHVTLKGHVWFCHTQSRRFEHRRAAMLSALIARNQEPPNA